MQNYRELLDEKMVLLRRMLAETQRMAELLEQQAVDDMPGCIAIRQELIDRLNELEGRIQADAAATAFLSGEPGRAYAGQTVALLLSIQELDAANMRRAEAVRDEAMRQIRESNAEKNLKVYQMQSQGQAKYINRQG